MTLPDVLELHIPQRKPTLRARVTWRRNDEIGLDFVEGAAAVPAAAQSVRRRVAERVALLETEIAFARRPSRSSSATIPEPTTKPRRKAATHSLARPRFPGREPDSLPPQTLT